MAQSYEASHGQRRVWCAEQSSSTRSEQTVPLVYKVSGPLCLERITHALGTVTAHHHALTSEYHLEDQTLRVCVRTKGERAELRADLTCVEAGSILQLDEIVTEFLNRPFDLSKDLSLRALILRVGAEDFRIVLHIHHAAGDGRSFDLLQDQISRLYNREPSNQVFDECLEFSHYVQSARLKEKSGRYDTALRTALEDIRACGVLERRNNCKPSAARRNRAFFRYKISPEMHMRLVALSRRHIGLGSSGAYLSAFSVVMAALRSDCRVVVGMVTENRKEPGYEKTVGYFSNILVVSIQLHENMHLHEVMASISTWLLDRRKSLDLPFGMLLERLHDSPYRFDIIPFDGLFTYQPAKRWPLMLADCTVQPIDPPFWPAPYPIMIDVEEGHGASVLVRYNPDIFPELLAQISARAFIGLLEAFSASETLTVEDMVEIVRLDVSAFNSDLQMRASKLRTDVKASIRKSKGAQRP